MKWMDRAFSLVLAFIAGVIVFSAVIFILVVTGAL